MRKRRICPEYVAEPTGAIKRSARVGRELLLKGKIPETGGKTKEDVVRRVLYVDECSDYHRLRSFIIMRQVRLVRKSIYGGWYCEFVNDDDRKALNSAAGWSDNKKQYLLNHVKFGRL